jgi:hypothetical protein
MTFNVTTNLYIAGNIPFIQTFRSASAGTPTTWKFDGAIADCQVAGCSFTDIDASSGNRIRALYSTVLRSPEIVQYRNSDIMGAGATLVSIN